MTRASNGARSTRPTLIAADEDGLARAGLALRAGHLVAFPTETVYGLGADATQDTAVAAIFATKNRPSHNPLIVHCTDKEQAAQHVEFTSQARALADSFWPGPLTLILPRRSGSPICSRVSAGLETLAVRVPAAPVAQSLLRHCGIPIAAPSANPSGCLSPTTAAHVVSGLSGRASTSVAFVLDGGPCDIGLESAVVDMRGDRPVLLRPGGLDLTAVFGQAVTGHGNKDAAPARPHGPGQMESHYCPRLPLRCNATRIEPGEALLSFGANAPTGAGTECNLSPTGDLEEAARNFFAMLHVLDGSGATGIAVMPIPEDGLGQALNDRLRRAQHRVGSNNYGT